MTKRDDGGAAFPGGRKGGVNSLALHPHPGMTVRTWLAGQALNGVLSNADYVERLTEQTSGGDEFGRKAVVCAIRTADALLAELKK